MRPPLICWARLSAAAHRSWQLVDSLVHLQQNHVSSDKIKTRNLLISVKVRNVKGQSEVKLGLRNICDLLRTALSGDGQQQ